MLYRAFIFSVLLVVITSGCLVFQYKTLYKDSDVKVVYHQPPTIQGFDSDSRPSSAYVKLTVAGRSYILADLIDYQMKGFVKTPDGSAIIFVAEDGKEFQSVMSGTLHVVGLKTKSDVAVPLGIHWPSFNPKLSVKSYDGHRLVLFVDSLSSDEPDGNLEINLDAKQVINFERTKHPTSKSILTP